MTEKMHRHIKPYKNKLVPTDLWLKIQRHPGHDPREGLE